MSVETADRVDAEGWHPDMVRMLDYWRSIAPPGDIPARSAFDPTAIPRLLSGIWLLDVQHEPFRLRYRLVGTDIVTRHGRELTGQWIDEAHAQVPIGDPYYDRYRAICATRRPSWRRGRVVLHLDRNYGEIENILLPLRDQSDRVDIILGYSKFYLTGGRPVR